MAKRSTPNKPTIPMEQYRKQIGKQENKMTRNRVKDLKKKNVQKTTIQNFNSYLVALAIFLALLFTAYVIVYLIN